MHKAKKHISQKHILPFTSLHPYKTDYLQLNAYTTALQANYSTIANQLSIHNRTKLETIVRNLLIEQKQNSDQM